MNWLGWKGSWNTISMSNRLLMKYANLAKENFWNFIFIIIISVKTTLGSILIRFNLIRLDLINWGHYVLDIRSSNVQQVDYTVIVLAADKVIEEKGQVVLCQISYLFLHNCVYNARKLSVMKRDFYYPSIIYQMKTCTFKGLQQRGKQVASTGFQICVVAPREN